MVNEYASVGGGGPSAGYSGAGGGSAGSSYTGPDMGGGTNAPNTNPVGSDAWWSQEIASRESAARANTSDSPSSSSPSSSNANVVEPTSPSSYTDPRTGQTFATQAIAESLGYGPTLTAGERTDTYAKELEAAGQTGGYPAQLAYMARHDDPLAIPLGISGGGGTSGQDVSAQYLNRPDIYRVTDTKQLALMTTGLTAGQAAEQLYQSSKTKSEQRYYETLLRQAETTATGKSAAYHTFAKETGLPQAPNPYEYTADLYVYLEKGYPTSEKERFSPVDYTVLGLSGGKGLNAYVWGDQKHDFTTALDVIAKAEKTGEMGPYGKLGAYSSGYGVLPLSLQQAIGAAAATSPYKVTPDKISFDFWGQTPEQMGRGKYVAIGDAGLTKVATGQKVSASGPVVTYTGLPTPFVSGKIEKPTGEVTIPFTDIKFTVPGLAFFQPSTFISGRASEVKEVPYSAMAGPDYTRQYVSSVTGKPIKEFTVAYGEPTLETRIGPETGKMEEVTTQQYITYPELPQTAKSYTLATTELPSAYETFLSKEFRSRIPTPKEGETLLAVSQLVNPLSQENAPLLAGKAIGYTAMEKLGLDTKPAKETGELVSSLTSPTKGQYTFFYEHPETAVVSYAAGGLFGAGTRVLGAIASKSRTLSAIAPYVSKYGGPALGGLYVGGATYEETGGFRTFTPETVAATKARLTQEGIPMTVGFGHGYGLPETIGGIKQVATTKPIVESRAPQTAEISQPSKPLTKEQFEKLSLIEKENYNLYGSTTPMRDTYLKSMADARLEAAVAAKTSVKAGVAVEPSLTSSERAQILLGLEKTSGRAGESTGKKLAEARRLIEGVPEPQQPIDIGESALRFGAAGGRKSTTTIKSVPEEFITKTPETPGWESTFRASDVGREMPISKSAEITKLRPEPTTAKKSLPYKEPVNVEKLNRLIRPEPKVAYEVIPHPRDVTPHWMIPSELELAAQAEREAILLISIGKPSVTPKSNVATSTKTESLVTVKQKEAPEYKTIGGSDIYTPTKTPKSSDITRTPTPDRKVTPVKTISTIPKPVRTTVTTRPVVTPSTGKTTTKTPPPEIPPIKTPTVPVLPPSPTATGGGGGGTRLGAKRFTEQFRVGEGIGYITLAARKQVPSKQAQPKPSLQRPSAFTAPPQSRTAAPQMRSVGKTPQVGVNIPAISKKGRKRG